MQNSSKGSLLSRFEKILADLTIKQAIWIITIVGLVVYFNSLLNGFAWDDFPYILLNPVSRSFNLAVLIGNNAFNSLGQYRPVAAIYFGLLYSLFKDSAFFYHFIELSIHIANALLLFTLFRRFFKNSVALFLTLIFLIHPIQVESVSFIASTLIPLFFLLGFAAFLIGIKNKINRKILLITPTLLLLSILTKEEGFLFLIMILVYRYLIKKITIGPFFISGITIGLVYIAMRVGFGGALFEKSGIAPIAQLSLTGRLLNIPAIIFFYLKTFVFPAQLTISQYWVVKTIDLKNFYLPAFVDLSFFALIICGYIYLYKRNKKLFNIFFFFFIWFIGGLFFHLQIVPLDMTVADRWFYLPAVGLLGMIGVIFQSVYLHRNAIIKTFVYVLAIIILIILSIRTMVRNTDWRDSLTLYLHDSKINDNFAIESNIGVEYSAKGQDDIALIHYQKSIQLFPYAVNLYNTGNYYGKRGDMDTAREYYYKAIDAPAFSEAARKDLSLGAAKLLISHDTPLQAKAFVNTLLLRYPKSAELWADFAICEYYLHNQDQALAAAYKAKILLNNGATNYLYNLILNKRPNNEINNFLFINLNNN
jgi:hypothetical protein